jgi:hypothetical protein
MKPIHLDSEEKWGALAFVLMAAFFASCFVYPSIAGILEVITILYIVGGALYWEIMKA